MHFCFSSTLIHNFFLSFFSSCHGLCIPMGEMTHIRRVYYYVYLHLHLSLNREGRWETTKDFKTSFLHFSLFSTALWDLANSRPVHSLTLFPHLFFCLSCLLPPFTVPCKIVLPKPLCIHLRQISSQKSPIVRPTARILQNEHLLFAVAVSTEMVQFCWYLVIGFLGQCGSICSTTKRPYGIVTA